MIWYLAGPIDFATHQDWKSELKDLVNSDKHQMFFDPYGPYDFNKLNDRFAEFINTVNMSAIEQCDGVVVKLHKGDTTIGTILEMNLAREANKKLIIYTDLGDSVYMRIFAKHAIVVDSLKDLAKSILQETFILEDEINASPRPCS